MTSPENCRYNSEADGYQPNHSVSSTSSSSTTFTKKCGRLKNATFGVSFCANVFFLGMIFCWFILQGFRSKDTCTPEESPSPPLEEDVFYSCSPCSPMRKADDVDMNLDMGNTSHVCCRKINTDIQLQEPNTGQLLEKCQSRASNGTTGALLYINLSQKACTSGLHWINGKGSSYLRGGMKYEDLQGYGRLVVPSDGMYAVYSYIQFDSYTGETTLNRPKPEMHVLYKNEDQLIHMNKFMLRQASYTKSQVGPILVQLKAEDRIHVVVDKAEFIYNDNQLSVFGLYKL